KLRLDGSNGSNAGSLSFAGLIGTSPVIAPEMLVVPSQNENMPLIPEIADALAGSVRQPVPSVAQFGFGSAGATFGPIVSEPMTLNPSPLKLIGIAPANASGPPNTIAAVKTAAAAVPRADFIIFIPTLQSLRAVARSKLVMHNSHQTQMRQAIN
ncbi:MAG: hypothetical protein ABI190_10695, partial [Casimicrobiaceae bacterium]